MLGSLTKKSVGFFYPHFKYVLLWAFSVLPFKLSSLIAFAYTCACGNQIIAKLGVIQIFGYIFHGARWIMIAALAGQKTETDLKNIYVRNVRIIGSTLRSRTPETKAEKLADLVRDVWPKVSAGEVRPTLYTRFCR